MEIAAEYLCGVCGSWNDVLVDPTGGSMQEFIEDCAVCCRPHLLRVRVDPGAGTAEVAAEPC